MTALHLGLDPDAPGERYQVAVHVDAPVLNDPDHGGQSVLADGPRVSAETSRRLACDASIVVMRHDEDAAGPPASRLWTSAGSSTSCIRWLSELTNRLRPPRLRVVIVVMATPTSASLTKWRRNAVRQIAASRKSTLAFIARLPEREILRPRTLDKWSVKDLLAHLMSCDEETIRRLRLIERGRADRILWFNRAIADRFNARTVGRARRLRLPAVLRRMARVRAELITRLQRLPAKALADPSHDYTVKSWLPVPGWSHERDHVSEARAWWRSRRPQIPR